MARFLVACLVMVLVSGPGRTASADDAAAILDKAMKALGGGERLGQIEAATWAGGFFRRVFPGLG